MTRSSARHPSGLRTSLRSVRSDGTPVYRYDARPGLPRVSATRFDSEVAHADLPRDHRHAHDFFALVYVEEGDGSVRMDGVDRSLRTGEVHAVPPEQVIGISASSRPVRCRAWSLAFSPDAVPSLAAVSPLTWTHHPLLALFVPGAGRAVVPEPDRERWSGWFTDLAEELADPGRVGVRESAAALLTRILVASARLAPAAPNPLEPLVVRVFEEIEATFVEPVSARDVAAALGYTPGHLTTIVRERTGRPLLAWINERRLTEARRLLRDTDLPLDVVASRTGLRDSAYLVRRFRHRYGITPERWRRAERQAP